MQGLPVATTGSTVIRSNRMESVLSHDTSGITPVISRSHQLGENAHTVDVPGSGFSVEKGACDTQPPKTPQRLEGPMAVTTPTRNRSTSPYLNANRPWTCPPQLHRQLTQHIRQNSAIAVVLDFLRSIHAHHRGERDLRPIGLHGAHRRGPSAAVQRGGHAFDVIGLRPDQLETRRALARLEFERQHAHADQVGAVYALEALGDHGADTEQQA